MGTVETLSSISSLATMTVQQNSSDNCAKKAGAYTPQTLRTTMRPFLIVFAMRVPSAKDSSLIGKITAENYPPRCLLVLRSKRKPRVYWIFLTSRLVPVPSSLAPRQRQYKWSTTIPSRWRPRQALREAQTVQGSLSRRLQS